MAVLGVPREWPIGQIRQYLRSIAQEKLDYQLKQWQDLGAAKLLTGKDVMLLVATGEGKSTVFKLYALARPKDIVLVVSPLKMLEENMVQNLCDKEFKAVALNADTISAAQREGKNLWQECGRGEHQLIFVSPELLASEEMNKLLAKREFQRRLGLVVVDEVHLIPVWGVDFRRAFLAIGSLRSRLLPTTVFLALTATLIPGKPQRIVEKSLGLAGERYCLIKLDCARENLFIRLRRIDHSISGSEFKDLDWLLTEYNIRSAEELKNIPKTIIFMNSVLQGYRASRYLQYRLPGISDRDKALAIRHLHASTCSSCKRDLLADFTCPDGNARIVFATDAFGCGIDIPDIARVINLGTPSTADTGNQRIGRAGRGLDMGEAYIYVGSRLWDATKKQIESGTPADGRVKCDEHFRTLLEAHHRGECINKQIAILYGDRVDLEDFDSCGQCSGCVPETPTQPNGGVPQKRKRAHKRVPLVQKAQNRGSGRLTAEMTKKTGDKLAFLVMEIWLSVPVDQSRHFDGVDSFLPDSQVALLNKHLRDLDTTDQIQRLLVGWDHWSTHGDKLASGILRIRARMIEELNAIQARKGSEGRQPTERRLPTRNAGAESESGSDSEPSCESESDVAPPMKRQTCSCQPSIARE